MKPKSKASPIRALALCFLLFYLGVTLLPPILYRYGPGPGSVAPVAGGSSPSPSLSPAPTAEASTAPGDSFTLRDSASGESLTVDSRDFIISNLACEMDLNAPREALKAQAVAAYTYYSRMQKDGGEIPCDTENWLVYVTTQQMRERWGEDYEEYMATLEGVADEVQGQTLTYKGELILSSYFAISPGSTENVGNVWAEGSDEEHPYLQAVASPGDMLSDGYLSHAEFTTEELSSLLDVPCPEPETFVTGAEYTPSGTVRRITLGGREFTGQEVRGALSLRSAAFTAEPTETGLRFTVRGWGHGVGLSQAGAVFMAKAGAGYREILRHYYPGAQLSGA